MEGFIVCRLAVTGARRG